MSQVTLYYAGQPGEGFGWGVCNRYLIRELSKLCTVHTPYSDAFDGARFTFPVFVPLADHDFNPISGVRGSHNFAYTFFESELGPNAAANAAKYDVVFCGSTWCLERMKERGITNGRVLIQGVDHEIFRPMPVTRTDNEFRIFSGGKFEYRKGQDIVIAAFRELAKKYDNMRLVCAWHNPWPGLIQSMAESPHLDPAEWPRSNDLPQPEYLKRLAVKNGVPHDRITVLDQLSQPDLAAVMNQTDLGVFPNRCEGGTNLVLMEYMACGKPASASTGTGHADIHAAIYPNSLRKRNDAPGWSECSPESVANELEQWVNDTPEARVEAGEQARKAMLQFTWERAARTIVETVIEFQ